MGHGRFVAFSGLFWLKLPPLKVNTNSYRTPKEILTEVPAFDGAVVKGDT